MESSSLCLQQAWAGRAKRGKAEPKGLVALGVPRMLQAAWTHQQRQRVPTRDLGTRRGSAPGAGADGGPPSKDPVEAEPGVGEA